MKLFMYGVKDNVEGGFVFFFQAINEGIMKRMVKSALLSKEPNFFSTNLKDKSIYCLGSIETETGVIEPLQSPVWAENISQIRLDLIQEIKIAKQEAGDKNPKADEVVKDD